MTTIAPEVTVTAAADGTGTLLIDGTIRKLQAKDMQGRGYRIKFTVEPRQQHRLKAAEIDLSRRLFDEIESCK